MRSEIVMMASLLSMGHYTENYFFSKVNFLLLTLHKSGAIFNDKDGKRGPTTEGKLTKGRRETMETVACGLLGSNSHLPEAVQLPHLPEAVQLPHLPEAACSVNGYFHVDGYPDRFQATGRGGTADEAARNLRATMEATRRELAAPPPLPSREARLAQLLTCGLTKAAQRGDTGLVERLAKAAALILSGAVEATDREQALAVRSATHADTWYTVEGISCSCPDWAKHRKDSPTYLCKHVCAALMTQKLVTQEQEGR